MALEVVWMPEALEGLENILNYLENKWSTQSANNFLDSFEAHVSVLCKYPNSGSLEVPDKSIRGMVINNYTKVFYRFNDEQLILLRIFDTRQNIEGI